MAIIIRLENEMPPLVVPPYSMNGDTPLREVLMVACAFYKRPLEDSKLVNEFTGEDLPLDDSTLAAHGLGHWSMVTLASISGKPYPRVSFG